MSLLSLREFLTKQLIDVIECNEPVEGVLSWRYPMDDAEIQNGGQLTVRESQLAAFVNEGRIADVFGPGLHTLNTRNLPLLTDLMNWDKGFESPFRSDVYFFSTRLQMDRKWGTATPITIREKEFGAVRLRGYGIYAYRIKDARKFFTEVSGTRDTYYAEDLEGQLKQTIVARMTDVFAAADVAFLDMARNQAALAERIATALQPSFAALGLELNSFTVESISLPDELTKVMDQRIGVQMAGNLNPADLGPYTQFQAAQALATAAANPGGAAGAGVGIGAGITLGRALAGSLTATEIVNSGAAPGTSAQKFCTACGQPMKRAAKFCPECGVEQ